MIIIPRIIYHLHKQFRLFQSIRFYERMISNDQIIPTRSPIWLWLKKKVWIATPLRGDPDVWNEGVTQVISNEFNLFKRAWIWMDREYGSPVRPGYGSGHYILSCSNMHRTHSHNPTDIVCPTINYILSLAMALVNCLASGLHTLYITYNSKPTD